MNSFAPEKKYVIPSDALLKPLTAPSPMEVSELSTDAFGVVTSPWCGDACRDGRGDFSGGYGGGGAVALTLVLMHTIEICICLTA